MTAIIIVLIVFEPIMLCLGAFLCFIFLRTGIKFDTGRDIELKMPTFEKKSQLSGKSSELSKLEQEMIKDMDANVKGWFYPEKDGIE